MKEKRKIFINQDSGYLMIDIINAYAQAGYKCILLTGRLVERNIPLAPGTKIEKIIRYNRSGILKRLFTWIVGFFQIVWKVKTKYRHDELFIVSNPPLATLLPNWVKNQCDLLIFDIYPDALVETGYLTEQSYIIKLWKKLNSKAFAKANKIFTISDGMKQVLQSYTTKKTVEAVPLWTDNTFLKPIEKESNPFILKHNLQGKFIVMYSGNLGLSSEVHIVVDIAATVGRTDIIFLVIGEGAKKDLIREKSLALGLTNLIMLPWQSTADLPYSLSAADLAFVFLGKNISKLALPSKLFNFLSVGAPILCIARKGSEVESLVNKYSCGYCYEPDDIKGISECIVELAENNQLHSTIKKNSLKASEDFSCRNARKFLQEAFLT